MQVLYDPANTIERVQHIMDELNDQNFYEECSQLYYEVRTDVISDDEVMSWSTGCIDTSELEEMLVNLLEMFDQRSFDNGHIDRVNARIIYDSVRDAWTIDEDGFFSRWIIGLASLMKERNHKNDR